MPLDRVGVCGFKLYTPVRKAPGIVEDVGRKSTTKAEEGVNAQEEWDHGKAFH